jgi:hypothetical protein
MNDEVKKLKSFINMCAIVNGEKARETLIGYLPEHLICNLLKKIEHDNEFSIGNIRAKIRTALRILPSWKHLEDGEKYYLQSVLEEYITQRSYID